MKYYHSFIRNEDCKCMGCTGLFANKKPEQKITKQHVIFYKKLIIDIVAELTDTIKYNFRRDFQRAERKAEREAHALLQRNSPTK